MVPQAVRAVLQQMCVVHPEIESVSDPFAGSGTVLTESMLKGLNFCGTDINPLAILLCRVKSGPFFVDALAEKVLQIIARIEADFRTGIDVNFTNRDKWFEPNVQIKLSQIRRAILREDALWARRFFWVGLAETVRLTSNSRTSTFKLHVRPKSEIRINKRNCDPISIFKKAIIRNLCHLKEQAECLVKAGHLNRGHYRMDLDVKLGDTRHVEAPNSSDIVLTSPPYGDNTSTVPYGQYSYLALQWVQLSDIGLEVDPEVLRSTSEIDRRSLGGSKRITTTEKDALADSSPAFRRYILGLKDQPPDRVNRVVAFFRDLNVCLPPILNSLRAGGLMAWTLGNRKVGGKKVPLDKILSELLAVHNASLVCRVQRQICSKRMALKNSVAETMSSEAIMVMRKAV